MQLVFFNDDFCFTSFQHELLSPSTSCTSRAKQGLAETNFFWRYPGQWSYIYFQSIREVGVAVKTIFPKTKSLKVGLQWEFHSKGFWNIGCKKVLFAVGLYWWGAVFDGWKLCFWCREVVGETYGFYSDSEWLEWWFIKRALLSTACRRPQVKTRLDLESQADCPPWHQHQNQHLQHHNQSSSNLRVEVQYKSITIITSISDIILTVLVSCLDSFSPNSSTIWAKKILKTTSIVLYIIEPC